MGPLKAGEYDLVNISIIGYDPITGRTFDECMTEWEDALAKLTERAERLRWWQLRERFAIANQIAILRVRRGY